MADIERHIDKDSMKIRYKGTVITIDRSIILAPFSISGEIRFHPEDFRHLAGIKRLVHFNLQKCGHIPDRLYLLVEIAKPGHFDGQEEVLPVLKLENAIVARCTGVKNHVAYSDLKDGDLRDSLPNIRSIPELKAAILRRYSSSLPYLTKEDILEAGVSLTWLELLDQETRNFRSSLRTFLEQIPD